LWRDILERVPDSRLILHTRSGFHRDRVLALFAKRNISRDRIEFVGFIPITDYFRLYDRIDIGLDPFPFAGGTTTCDALWMGVPVVTLAGDRPTSRAGVSILSNAGLPELIARTHTEYASIATQLARDVPRLVELRKTLRPRLELSPLTNADRFATHIEAAYRLMWQRWCESEREP